MSKSFSILAGFKIPKDIRSLTSFLAVRQWGPASVISRDVHLLTSTLVAIVTGECSHVGVEAAKDVRHHRDLTLVGEAGVHLGQEPSCGSVIDVEHHRGVADGGGALVTKTLNCHHIVQAHLLHNQIIKGHKTIAYN